MLSVTLSLRKTILIAFPFSPLKRLQNSCYYNSNQRGKTRRKAAPARED